MQKMEVKREWGRRLKFVGENYKLYGYHKTNRILLRKDNEPFLSVMKHKKRSKYAINICMHFKMDNLTNKTKYIHICVLPPSSASLCRSSLSTSTWQKAHFIASPKYTKTVSHNVTDRHN